MSGSQYIILINHLFISLVNFSKNNDKKRWEKNKYALFKMQFQEYFIDRYF